MPEIGQTISQYRIVEKLGAGGMGEVFLADDLSLGRKVALKFLPQDMRQDSNARKRFLREAKSVAALDHPNICAIHEFCEVEGKDFIVMEYVDGQTLRDRLAKGPVLQRDALESAAEIAEALEAAHEQGIIHRDLKPANIMLTKKGRAKVMDFGLAKHVLPPGMMEHQEETITALTKGGMTVGTLAYMSPEQLRGKEVDARSDLFSFGIVLYEMLTGVHPFKRTSGIETANAILSEMPPPPDHYKCGLPDLLQNTLMKMLAKNPDQRCQSAHEVQATLKQALLGGQEGSAPRRVLRTLRPAVVLIAVVFAVAAIWWAGGNYFRSPRTALAFKERDWILMADFKNLTGDKVFDNALDTAMAVSIQQSRYVNVFPRSRVQQTLARMRKEGVERLDEVVGREIAIREGIKALVVCGISRVGEDYLLTAEIVDPNTQAVVASDSSQAKGKAGVLAALDELAKRTREKLGESLASITQQRVLLPEATTSSLEALKAFAESRRVSGTTATELLKQAVEIDPDFALAHADLGLSLFIDGKRPEGEEHFKKALNLLDRLTVRERLWIRAVVEDWRGNREQGIENYKLYLAQYPDDSMAWFRLGYTYLLTSRRSEAIQAFEKVIRIDTSDASSHINIATCYNGLGQYDKAVVNYERAFQLAPADLTGVYVNREYGFMLVKMGQIEKATQVFQKAIASANTDEKAKGYRSLGLLAIYRGKYANAVGYLKESMLLNKAAGLTLSELRDHLYLAAVFSTKRMDGAFDKEMAEVSRLLKENTFDPYWLQEAGKAYARKGRIQEATSLMKEISRRVGDPQAVSSINRSNRGDQAAYLYLKGEIELAQNRFEEAIASFESAGKTKDASPDEPLARAYHLSGKLEEAIARYRAYLTRKQPDEESWVLAHYHLGRTCEQKGMREKAAESYKELLEMWKEGDEDLPPLVDAKRRLVNLDSKGANQRSTFDIHGNHREIWNSVAAAMGVR